MGKIKGIDISYWQGTVDFNKVKNDGIKFVILREGYRQTVDDNFFEYVKGCTKAGIPVLGVYHFCYALNVDQAKQEAVSCINNVKKAGLGKDVIIFFDFEYDTVTKAKAKGVNLGRSECIAFTKAFCEQVEKLGYKAGIYSNIDYYKNMYSKDLIDKYVFWLAHYTTGEPAYSCVFQQYGSTGKVNGISGNVDMDWFFGNLKERKVETVNDRQKVLDVARSWIGCKESDGSHRKIIDVYNSHKPLARGYAVKYTDAWCATFVSAVAIKAGVTDILPTECGCGQQVELFKKLGEWVENDGYKPSAGDVIFYDWDDSGSGDNTGWSDHVGIVESCDGKTITVIEGNKNDAVGRRSIPVNGRYIRGFGVPKYSSKESTKPSTPSPQKKKTVDELAKEVINGKWGNGDARKKALTDAGYDYSAVQNRVNQILKGSSKKSVEELAREVIQGKWGNGQERKDRLTKAGYDYSAVQKRVNQILS